MEENKEVKKLSYEELENVAKNLTAQCNQLYAELQKANMTNAFKRLDYLFKIVENREVFPTEFVQASLYEIQGTMTIPSEEDVNTEE